MAQVWASVDAGKAHHHCLVIDADGKRLLSRRVANDEPELAPVISSLPGIGTLLGAEFLAATGGDMEFFGTPHRLAGFAGLAPAPWDSGRIRGNLHQPKRADQIVAVIGQQPQLPLRAVQPRGRQAGLAQRRPCHRQRVDRAGLAVGAGRVPGVRHQLGRHPHDLLTCGQQVGLQPPGQMPAVLHRPRAVRPEPVCPPDQVRVRGRRGRPGHPHS
jgi:Transposase IS116/IS110/IS902 family